MSFRLGPLIVVVVITKIHYIHAIVCGDRILSFARLIPSLDMGCLHFCLCRLEAFIGVLFFLFLFIYYILLKSITFQLVSNTSGFDLIIRYS